MAQSGIQDMMSNFRQKGIEQHSMVNSPLNETFMGQNFRGAQS